MNIYNKNHPFTEVNRPTFFARFTALAWIVLFIISIVPTPLQASALEESRPHVKGEIVQEGQTISAGHPFWVAIHLSIEPDWHVYWKNPGDAGVPISIEWTLPQGFEASAVEWPFPEKFTLDDLVGFGYENEVTLLVQMTPPSELVPNTTPSLEAKVNWLVCSSTSCQPGGTTLKLPLMVGQDSPTPQTALFSKAREKIPLSYSHLKATRQVGDIQLELTDLSDNLFKDKTIESIYFFPEEQDLIDLSAAQTIAKSTESPHGYLITLKESGDRESTENDRLRGVLVFQTLKGQKKKSIAIAIDRPIENQAPLLNGGELSLASPPVSKPHQLKQDTDKPSDDSHAFQGGLALALAFAFLGGMILNLMPCVLPVMSFKVMSFVKMAGQSRTLTFRHGLIFSLGVIVSFWILASAILTLRTYGQIVGWGFQLQHPLFVLILATLLFLFALNLFGLFEWGMFLSSWAGDKQVRHKNRSSNGYTGSFFSGVLATAVATPCTGPFLGSAVGFALTLPSLQALLIFTSLGVGMSFPYLLLAAFPACLRFLPKPGPWMETFKQLMGFVMMATVLWLIWVFSAQTNSFSIICLLAGFFFLSIGCWVYGKGCVPSISKKNRVLAFAFVALFGYIGVQTMLFPRADWDREDTIGMEKGNSLSTWQNFSPDLVAQLTKEGKPVLIDFTAKWCLICQTNHIVLNSGEVVKSLDKAGVVRMKADWTKNDPVITKELSKFGRNSVPLYVLYKPGEAKPTILPQVLTPDVVLSYLDDKESREEIALN